MHRMLLNASRNMKSQHGVVATELSISLEDLGSNLCSVTELTR